MIVGIGSDLLDVERMEHELAREGAGFRDDVFTPGEIACCSGKAFPARHYAARFAAKEAFWKAAGCGPEPVSLRDVEVVREHDRAAPELALHGRADALAQERGVTGWLLSLTHTEAAAIALAIATGPVHAG